MEGKRHYGLEEREISVVSPEVKVSPKEGFEYLDIGGGHKDGALP